jgi:hypothetical protein
LRVEIARNRAAVAERLPYHRGLKTALDSVQRRPARTLGELQSGIRLQGSRSVDFAHTAYDLALATQALSYLPRDLAFSIADVYLQQQGFEKIQDAMLQAILATGTFSDANTQSLSVSLAVYMGDVVYQEPRLIAMYDRLLPRLDSALARPRR